MKVPKESMITENDIFNKRGTRLRSDVETVVSGQRYTLQEIVNKFNEFVKTEQFEIMHGNIENRQEITQWGFRWFINWMRQNHEAH